jgi:hypothetical protein
MSPEVWSTIFAGATFIVIAATAIAALIQLRHLRASNQLNTLLTLMRMWQAADLQEHMGYVRGDLQQKIIDPNFMVAFRERALSRNEHRELLVADYWEQIGAFMKYNLMDEQSWIDVARAQVYFAWQSLEPIIKAMRDRYGPSAYENFEFAAVRAKLWLDKHPDGYYPAGTPRMEQLTAAEEIKAPI